MCLNVVGVPVTAERVVGGDHLRLAAADDLDEEVRSLQQIRVPEGVAGADIGHDDGAVLRAVHARVVVAASAAQKDVIREADVRHSLRQFRDAVLTQLCLREMLKLGHQDLATLAQRTRD